MGSEAACTLSREGASFQGKALLESDSLIFRGTGTRVVIPLREVSDVSASESDLRIAWSGQSITLTLGSQAEKWAERIRSPKSAIDKLGVKTGQRVSVLAIERLAEELEARGADVSARLRQQTDVVFLGIDKRAELDRLPRIVEAIMPDGAIWIVRPRGVAAITEADVRNAARQHGLVDVKVVRFSDSHTAEKLVIPREKRSPRIPAKT